MRIQAYNKYYHDVGAKFVKMYDLKLEELLNVGLM